jgi:hypothetical protein
MLKCPKNLVGKKIGSTFVSGMKKDSFVGVLLLFVYKQEIGSPLGKPTFVAVSSLSIPKSLLKDAKLGVHSSTIFGNPLVGGKGDIFVKCGTLHFFYFGVLKVVGSAVFDAFFDVVKLLQRTFFGLEHTQNKVKAIRLVFFTNAVL